jgi:hypothetical protein
MTTPSEAGFHVPPEWAPQAPGDWPPRPPDGVGDPGTGAAPDSSHAAAPEPAPAPAPPRAPENGAPPVEHPISTAVPQEDRPHERSAEPLEGDPRRATPAGQPRRSRAGCLMIVVALVVVLVLGVGGCVYSCRAAVSGASAVPPTGLPDLAAGHSAPMKGFPPLSR